MKKYRILCLTDHAKHSKQNSLYAIVSAMSRYQMVEEVVVASRSNPSNDSFFNDHQFDTIYGCHIKEDFTFEAGKEALMMSDNLINTNDFDLVFLRLPRPVTDDFLQKLEAAFSTKCIINRPSGIIECSNKSVLLNFQDVTPPIKLCHSIQDIMDFSSIHDIVLKPLREYGGKGILRIKGAVLNDGTSDHNTITYLESIESTIQSDGYLAMKYLKNVQQGDKRLIVVGGEVLAASLRLPPEQSWLCNVALGGSSLPSSPDERELEIIKEINPFLTERGILICGIDTLVDDDGRRTLSEINALSIGGFPQAEQQTGRPIIQLTIDKIIAYADQHYHK